MTHPLDREGADHLEVATEGAAEDGAIATLLRSVDRSAPPSRLHTADLIRRADRADRRRRGQWGAGVAALAAAVVVGLTTYAPTRSSGPVPGLAATPTGTTSAPATPARTTLDGLFGPDWTRDGADTGPMGGDLVLRPGTHTAGGLPTGYSAVVRVLPVDPALGLLATFCRSNVEKGLTTSACVPVPDPGAAPVEQQQADTRTGPPGSWSSVRLLRQRADGGVQIVDVIAYATSTRSEDDRAAARAWLARLVPTADAAVRLDPPTRN